MNKKSLLNKLKASTALCLVGLIAGHAMAQTWGPRPVPAQGPVEPSSGYFFSGTTGTAGGRQTTPATTPGESRTEKWWNGKGLLQGSGNPIFDGFAFPARLEVGLRGGDQYSFVASGGLSCSVA